MLPAMPGDLGDVYVATSCNLSEYYASMSHSELCRRLLTQERDLLSLQMTIAPMKAENVKMSRSLKQTRQQLEVVLQVLFSFFGSEERQEWLNQKWKARDKEDKELVDFFARLLRWHNAVRADTDPTVNFYQKLWRYDIGGGIFQNTSARQPDELTGEADMPLPDPEAFLTEEVVTEMGGSSANAASSGPGGVVPSEPSPALQQRSSSSSSRRPEPRVSPIPLPMLERLATADPLWKKVVSDVDRLIAERSRGRPTEDAAETGATASPDASAALPTERYIDYLADVVWLVVKHEPTFTNAVQLARAACGPKWASETEAAPAVPSSSPQANLMGTTQALRETGRGNEPQKSQADSRGSPPHSFGSRLSNLFRGRKETRPDQPAPRIEAPEKRHSSMRVPIVPPPVRPEPARRRMNL
mmetsp:Transcript_46789/g.111291  ORF Transcript_46789/g.111291 Transcript_46789/m.111291 type:complete len:415 (+) Transcript_46789:134-1378(+)